MDFINLEFLLQLTNSLIDQYGYPGIFIISLLASLIIFVPVPYFVPLILAALRLDPTLVALLSAAGATIAKIIVFKLSYYGGKLVNEQTRKRMKPFETLVSRYGWLASFLAAATPLPDDLIYIPLGFIRYNIYKFGISLFTGKFLLALIMTWGSRQSAPYVELLVDQVRDPLSALLVTVGLIVSSIIVILAIMKLDWERLLGRWISSNSRQQ